MTATKLAVRAGAKVATKRMNRLLEPLERFSQTGSIWPEPILIIGPPRSGTTLVYQLMVQQLDVAYLSNIHHALFGAPAIVEYLIPQKWRPIPSGQESHYGLTHGVWGPSEAGNFWYRFFPRYPHALDASAFSARQRARLRRAIGAMTRSSRRALLTKNTVCTVRLEAISGAIPEMRYVVVHRDVLDTASSLLRVREELTHAPEDWWGVQPPDIDKLRGFPPEQQVVEQVRSVQKSIEAARQAIGEGQFLDVSYEDLTSDPRREIDRLSHRLSIPTRTNAPTLPRCLRPSKSLNEQPELESRLRAYLHL